MLIVNKTNFFALIAFCAALIFALLVSVGVFGEARDTVNYIRIFVEINRQDSLWSLRYEPLFVLLVQLISGPQTKPAVVFFLLISTALTLKVFAVRNINGNALIFLVAYLSLWAATLEFNQIRTALAVSLFALVASSKGIRDLWALILGSISFGLHYSIAGILAAFWIYLVFVSSRKLWQKVVFVSLIALSVYVFFSILSVRFIPRIELLAELTPKTAVRVLSLFSVYVTSVTAVMLFYCYRVGVKDVPRLVAIGVGSSAIGIVLFFSLAVQGGFLAYRILETMSSLLPLALAWAWVHAGRSLWRAIWILVLLIGACIGPGYWSGVKV